MLDCKHLKKEDVLCALYNNSKPLGFGIHQFNAKNMTSKEAMDEFIKTNSFDYLHGRVMKLKFSTYPLLDVRLYNRDNGENAAENIIKCLLQQTNE